MGASEIGGQVYKLPSLNSGSLTILLGAGASASSGLPDWGQMVSNLLTSSHLAANEDIANKIVHNGDLVLLAEAVRLQYREDEWLSALRRALYMNSNDPLTPSSMQLSAALLACEHLGKVHLATLNFDQLLEQACTQTVLELENRFTTVETDYLNESLSVQHLHGEIPCREMHRPINSPIFSFYDYLTQLQKEAPFAREYLKNALDSGSIIIAGTSFRDPDMRQWLADILRNGIKQKNHCACILIARESYPDVDARTFKTIAPVLEAQWQSLGFIPIFVDDYEDVAQLIRECSHIDEDGYLDPQTRINQLWAQLTDKYRFEDIQKIFSRLLRNNKKHLKQKLNLNTRMNATLWFAHDHRLYRYASHDRIYIKSNLLRFDPVGFDSPYIAGRAYGANKTMHETMDKHPANRWRTVVATPIVCRPKIASWRTSLPIGVLSFGIESKVPDTPPLTDALTTMSLEWARIVECFVESGGNPSALQQYGNN